MATPGQEPLLLGSRERVAALVVAAVAIVLALLAYLDPPERRTAVEGCQAESPASCVVTVDADGDAVSLALVGVAGVAALVGILGIRFTSVKAPGGFELGSAPTVTEGDPVKVEAEVREGELEPVEPPVGARGRSSRSWDDLPAWARSALYRWLADNLVVDGPVEDAVIAAYRPTGGRGAWAVELQTAGGPRTLRLWPAAPPADDR